MTIVSLAMTVLLTYASVRGDASLEDASLEDAWEKFQVILNV